MGLPLRVVFVAVGGALLGFGAFGVSIVRSPSFLAFFVVAAGVGSVGAVVPLLAVVLGVGGRLRVTRVEFSGVVAALFRPAALVTIVGRGPMSALHLLLGFRDAGGSRCSGGFSAVADLRG